MEYVGIDIVKRKFGLAWLSSESGKIRSKKFTNTPVGFNELQAWLSKHELVAGRCHLAMEATGPYYEALATMLCDAGYKVSVINPAQIKSYGDSLLGRQKTDRADAALIARYCAVNQPMAWSPPPFEVRELQRVVARLEAMRRMHVEEQDRQYGLRGEALLLIERVMHGLGEEEARLRQVIQDLINLHPDLRQEKELLCSIPDAGSAACTYPPASMRADADADAER